MDRNKIIEDNLGLVISVALKFNPKDEHELQDYIQVGVYGLLKALNSYNANRANLSTFIWICVKRKIINYIKKEKRYKPLPLTDKEYIIKEEFWEFVPDTLDVSEQETITLRREGLTLTEISKKLKCGKTKAGRILKSATTKINDANP